MSTIREQIAALIKESGLTADLSAPPAMVATHSVLQRYLVPMDAEKPVGPKMLRVDNTIYYPAPQWGSTHMVQGTPDGPITEPAFQIRVEGQSFILFQFAGSMHVLPAA